MVFESRWLGRPLPMPEHVPVSDPGPIVERLAALKACGTPAYVDTTVSCGVRLCSTAVALQADIAGTFFRIGGEPFSRDKAAIFDRAGCLAAAHYSIAEIGRLGMACLHRRALDEVHLLTDRLALIQRPVEPSPGAERVGGLFVTSLLPSSPKIMINVEAGDYGVLGEGPCQCPFGRLGLSARLHTIRSYEKLTSEGMHFLGGDLLDLVERILPARFGGQATDYQFVEEAEHGLPRVALVISPRVGALDEAAVVATVLDELAGRAVSGPMMARIWRDGRTLRIVRREPYVTSSAKIQALHVVGRTVLSSEL